MAGIPPYEWPGGQVGNVQPFTFREGRTYLKRLEQIVKYMNLVVIPYINTNVGELDEKFTEQVNLLITTLNAALLDQTAEVDGKIATLEAYVDDAVATIIGDSVVVQDPVVAALVANVSSATRTALDLVYASKATQTTVETGRLSTTALDAAYASQETEDIVATGRLSSATLGAQFSAIDADITVLETLVASGRLSQASLDARYVLKPNQKHMVIIGSSNATDANTWPTKLATALGLTKHNFALGGGGFTQSGPTKFTNQITNAIADVTFPKEDVTIFLIADMGNDIRAQQSVTADCDVDFARIKNAYPNARIVLLPALWGNATDNNQTGRLMSISQRVAEAVNAGLPFGVELVDASWTWHADTGAFMKPGEVHYTPLGDDRVYGFLRRWFKGNAVRYDKPVKFVSPAAAVTAGTAYWKQKRVGDLTTIEGSFVLPATAPVDTVLGTLEYGCWPLDATYCTVIGNDRVVRSLAINAATGTISSLSELPANTYRIQVAFNSF